jgi:hypothetical protein
LDSVVYDLNFPPSPLAAAVNDWMTRLQQDAEAALKRVA